MNERLRAATSEDLAAWRQQYASRGLAYEVEIANLRDAFGSAAQVVHDDEVVYRGVDGPWYNGSLGDVVTDLGFMSTSTNQGAAEAFGSGRWFTIHVPPGKRYLIGTLSEHEALWPTDTRLQLDRVDNDGYPIEVTML